VKVMGVSEFRANMMNFLQRAEKGERLIITSRGKQIAQILPPEDVKKRAKEKLKKIGKSCRIGDIISPTGETWKSLK